MSDQSALDGYDSWPAYWQAQGQPWRTQPEVDEERQRFLTERRAVTPDIEKGIYPFKEIKLDRADVEWLLATHESGRGPVRWEEEKDKPYTEQREGLDLRGADLRQSDLSGLPLARLRGGLTYGEWATLPADLSAKQGQIAAAHFERATLRGTHFEGASLIGGHFRDAVLIDAHLEWASLHQARLDAYLNEAHLEHAFLFIAQLENANLYRAHLAGADLRFAFFDARTYLAGVELSSKADGAVSVADVRWGDVNLAAAGWTEVRTLGDERLAGRKVWFGRKRTARERLQLYQGAVRANRQLATVLRDQGLNEHADRFAYHAHVLQRQVLLRQGQWPQALASWLLDIVAGHGYRTLRTIFWYLAVVGSFAFGYLQVTHGVPLFGLTQPVCSSQPSVGCVQPLQWYEALVLSVASFHGRGFFPQGTNLGDPVAILAAAEAVFGLFIEVTFIATFTQRYFAR